jgi:antitoxin ChpS
MTSGDDQMPADSETGDGVAAEPAKRRRYTLDELIAKCDPTAPAPEIDRLWTEGKPVGDEVI